MLFNVMLETAILSNLLAQLLKIPLYYLKHGKWLWRLMLSSGGMPSSHAAFVSALAVAIALHQGVDSVYFALAFVLAAVVIYDAMGIRRHAGKHAAILNKLIADLLNLKVLKGVTDPEYQREFKELLGHEPIETFWGMLFGIAIAMIYAWLAS